HASTRELGRRTAEAAVRPRLRSAGVQALNGTVVTMQNSGAVLQDHTIYIRDGLIVDIRPDDAPSPDGFDGVAALKSAGLIFPGMIDLHNHLAYDGLRSGKCRRRSRIAINGAASRRIAR